MRNVLFKTAFVPPYQSNLQVTQEKADKLMNKEKGHSCFLFLHIMTIITAYEIIFK